MVSSGRRAGFAVLRNSSGINSEAIVAHRVLCLRKEPKISSDVQREDARKRFLKRLLPAAPAKRSGKREGLKAQETNLVLKFVACYQLKQVTPWEAALHAYPYEDDDGAEKARNKLYKLLRRKAGEFEEQLNTLAVLSEGQLEAELQQTTLALDAVRAKITGRAPGDKQRK